MNGFKKGMYVETPMGRGKIKNISIRSGVACVKLIEFANEEIITFDIVDLTLPNEMNDEDSDDDYFYSPGCV